MLKLFQKPKAFFVFLMVSHLFSLSTTNTVHISNVRELENIFENIQNNLRLQLTPGTYSLSSTSMVDSTCGNCEDPTTSVNVTVGLLVSGREIHIEALDEGTVEIITNSGYGIFFLNCEDCSISGVSITGGQRDSDGNATDAAIVVKNSSVTITDCYIHDNIGDSTIVANLIVGVMGITGREESYITIENNQIIRNSWDGIALYHGAEALIRNNIIDGMLASPPDWSGANWDKAHGRQIGGGRGVGIGVTWDAKATIEGNLVTRYWKGIGLFVDADATVRENIVEDILTWGIALWDADRGHPQGRIEWNVIYNTGACGVSITRSDSAGPHPGYFCHNAVLETAQNPRYDDPDYYCYQCALAIHAAPGNFVIRDNWFTGNRRATEELPDYDVSEEEFYQGIQPLLKKFKAWPVLQNSRFLMRINK